MMKQFSFLFIVAGCFSAAVAQGQPHKVVADKIVGIVGDKIILKSDITNEILDRQRRNEQLPDNAECLVMEQVLALKALVLQAEKDSLVVSDDEIEALLENQVRGFIQAYGSKEALEQIAGRTVYQIKEDFRIPFRERKLADLMRQKIVEGVKITPTEVKAYYDKIPKDSLLFYESEVEIGQIIVNPKAGRELEKNSIDELTEFKRRVEAGESKFETLASLYTDDPGSKNTGGMYNLNRTEKQWDPTFLSTAFRLKEGQISGVIKSKIGYHIIQMIRREGDDATVRHILKIPQITDDEIKGAIARLDSVRAKLVAGTMQFGEAVARYSDDDMSKYTGGMMQCGNGSTFCSIADLKDERGKQSVRIIYLKTRTEPHRENLKDDYNRVAQRALEEKKGEALEKWFNGKIATYYVMVDDDYKSCPQLAKWVQNAANTDK
jgi:peptidyl-prolyl cis-trans isomerase SurA